MNRPDAAVVKEINGFFRDGDSFALVFESVPRGADDETRTDSSPLFVFSHDQLLVLRDAVDKAVELLDEDRELDGRD